MASKELIKTIITDSQAATLPETWERTLKIPTDTGKIVTLVGVRRSGKTYHLFNLINTLRESGVAPERLLYFNFEDERLQIGSQDLDTILQAYQELHPDIKLSDCYFFFDEVQEVEGWEKFVVRLSSITKQVYITGSNANLLSLEIATALRGKTITFEVYPLSFREFVNVLRPGLNSHGSSDRATLINLFRRFMHEGGFPETVTQVEELKDKILQEYFNVMVLKDLIDRYKIAQVAVLKYFCKRVVGASGGEFSVHKIYRDLQSQNYRIGKDALYDFQDYVEAIYLNRLVPKYSHSAVKTESAQKKTYVIDQGLGAALDYKLSQDEGRLLENTVALELLKRGKQIAYTQNGSECDFVTIEKGHVTEAIQVTFNIADEETRKREIRGLVRCCKAQDLQQGTILTLDHEEQLESEGVQISIVPTWRYFFGA